jgi:hypothetical protein
VFKAIDLNYDSWDNRLWEGPQPSHTPDPASPGTLPQKHTYVAIKRIIVTSSPRRILNELFIMESCRGCRHVAQIITAYRVEDQIVAVMPYQRSADLKVCYCGYMGYVHLFSYFQGSDERPGRIWRPTVFSMHVSCSTGYSFPWNHTPGS